MRRRSWLIVLLVLASVAFGMGIMLHRFPWAGMVFRPSAAAGPPGIHIEELKSAEELFALAGMKAVAVRFSGGDVDFWVEIESQGKKTIEGRHLSLSRPDKPPGPNQSVEGYYLLVRIPDDPSGTETWRMAYQREIVAAQSSGVQISTPVIAMGGSQGREERQSNSSTSATMPFQLWEKPNPAKAEAAVSSVRGPRPLLTEKAETMVSSVRSPLPPYQDVCLTEFTGRQKKEGALTEVFKIRVMCKAASDKDRGVKDDKTAN